MKIELKPDLRVETATPYTAEQIPNWVGYVNSMLEFRAECGDLTHDDESDPGGAVQLQQLAFMARMMATVLAQQKEIVELRDQLGKSALSEPAPGGEEVGL